MKVVTRTCDYPVSVERCGRPVEEPTRWALNNEGWEADLCLKHRAAFERAASGITDIAREVTGPGRTVRGRKVYKGKDGRTWTMREARTWLLEQGYDVASSGRIDPDLIEVFLRENGLR